jgi:mono/diheme cytochrome c family protein
MKKYVFYILAVLLLASFGTATADVHDGKRTFEKYCAKCHGVDGSVSKYGKAIKPYQARDLRTTRLFIAPVELLTIIKYGLYGREMKGWEYKLSSSEIEDVAEFVRTFEYKPNKKAGKEFYNKRCASCHSPVGSSKKIFQAPNLDMSPLGIPEMAKMIRFGRHGLIMNPKRALFLNSDLADVVEYLQSIKK